jgi:bis(5'-nucleosyl)-tetraphosphatase (symmetrical)
MMGYGDAAARCLLGNHDLNLLAVAQGVRKPHRKDTLHCVLDAPDRTAMLRLAAPPTHGHSVAPGPYKPGTMVHAGVLPTWTVYKNR